MSVDEDLTMDERKVRWRLVEKARLERAKGNVVMTTNRRVWINGRAWGWDKKRNRWQEDAERESDN